MDKSLGDQFAIQAWLMHHPRATAALFVAALLLAIVVGIVVRLDEVRHAFKRADD